jgi:glucuronate isomerase
MSKNVATTDIIGTGRPTEAEKKYRRYKSNTMLKIGMPIYTLTSHSLFPEPQPISKDRFSTNYKTADEFYADRDKVMQYLIQGKIAPEELVNKVAETVDEVHLRVGQSL